MSRGIALLVDDDDLILYCIQQLLESLDFEVVSASSGEEALEIFHRTPLKFDLVLLDRSMPGMDGYAIAAIIRKLSTTVKIIILSGHSPKLTSDIDGFLQKPYSRSELNAEIIKILW